MNNEDMDPDLQPSLCPNDEYGFERINIWKVVNQIIVHFFKKADRIRQTYSVFKDT